jgi:hypothetical protein
LILRGHKRREGQPIAVLRAESELGQKKRGEPWLALPSFSLSRPGWLRGSSAKPTWVVLRLETGAKDRLKSTFGAEVSRLERAGPSFPIW